MTSVRPPAVAGAWYPGVREDLARAVDDHLRATSGSSGLGRSVGIVAPHAGLVYSGPVAAYAYRELVQRDVDLVVLVGPSHFVPFEGVAAYCGAGFDSPLGMTEIDIACVTDLMDASPLVRDLAAPHGREHSLEIQLPFLKRVAPAARIVPLLMGRQTADTADALADALAAVLTERNAVLVASTDLSHYHDAATAARLDGVVLDHIAAFDADGLQRVLTATPEHACGGGPLVAVMKAARLLGADRASVLRYADSGDVSGDKRSVVGYAAAALGTA